MSKDAWGLRCTCVTQNRHATWHASACDLYQKFPSSHTTEKRGDRP